MNIKKLVVRTIGVATVFPNEPHRRFRQVQKLSVKNPDISSNATKLINLFLIQLLVPMEVSLQKEAYILVCISLVMLLVYLC